MRDTQHHPLTKLHTLTTHHTTMALCAAAPASSSCRRLATSTASSRRCCVVARAASNGNKPSWSPAKAAASAAAAAALLASASLPALAAAPAQQPAAPLNPTALVSAATSSGAQATGSGDAGLVTKLLDTIPDIFKGIKTDEDPFGADKAQEKSIADTKRPIPIPTEQEAVVTEAFPNPSAAANPRPPVLEAAEGDEHLGANAGQFSEVTAADRQELIDRKSPAQASAN